VTLRFDQPEWLWLALLAIPIVALGLVRLRGDERLRVAVILSVRVLLIVAIVAALARPRLVREHDDLTVMVLLDVSGSIRRFGDPVAPASSGEQSASAIARLRDQLRHAAAARRPDDRFGLIVFDGRSAVVAAPRRGDSIDDVDVTMSEGTDIAAAIRLGLAMFPAETNRRLLLVSDGLETAGDALAAAREAATSAQGAVPISVASIAHRHAPDAQVVRLEAPASARPGQTVSLRLVLDSSEPMQAQLSLFREDQIVDLDPRGPGTGRIVDLPAGSSVHVLEAVVDDRPVNRFVAVLEPVDPIADTLSENNRGEAIVTNPGSGAVLLVRGSGQSESSPFERLLRELGRPVTVTAPESIPAELLSLQAFDLVVLDDVSATQVDAARQNLLADYVDRLGGGLLVTGGRRSFGAGGWRGTPVERVLPIELDLPKQLRAPKAALILVLDKSGSMGELVGGARASQQQVANEAAALAIESLAARSYIGVVAFDQMAWTVVPLTVNENPKAIADATRGISPQGGTNIAAGLRRAQEMLRAAPPVEHKRIVLLTDGRSPSSQIETISAELVAENVSITTIAVGDQADEELLRRIAADAGGQFHAVRNPNVLPKVLVDSVQVVNQPLIREEPFQATVLPTGSRLAAAAVDSPNLGGLVLSTPREDPTAILELVTAAGEPVLAHWAAGLGSAVAFTSSLEGDWAGEWLAWPGWSRFWSDLVRRAARPGLSGQLLIETLLVDGRLRVRVTVEEPEPSAGGDSARESGDGRDDSVAVDPAQLTLAGVVYGPEGTDETIRLRRVSARSFEAEARADTPGSYVVAVTPRQGDRPLVPLVTGIALPAGEEYRRREPDMALLQSISSISGGSLLAPGTDLAEVLWDRRGMAPVVAAQPIWTWFALLALVILVLDVAARRLAWSPREAGASMRLGLARSRHSGGAGSTLSRLRGVAPAARSASAGDGRSEAPLMPSRATRPIRRTVGAALDALEGRGSTSERDADSGAGAGAAAIDITPPASDENGAAAAANTSRNDAPPTAPAEPSSDDARSSATASLFEAKRRARRRQEE